MYETEKEVFLKFYKNFKDVVIGHRIVDATLSDRKQRLRLTLDSGKVLVIDSIYDCCAYGTIENFVELVKVESVITGAKYTETYDKFSVFLLTSLSTNEASYQIDGAISEGSGYYSYGFNLTVVDVE